MELRSTEEIFSVIDSVFPLTEDLKKVAVYDAVNKRNFHLTDEDFDRIKEIGFESVVEEILNEEESEEESDEESKDVDGEEEMLKSKFSKENLELDLEGFDQVDYIDVCDNCGKEPCESEDEESSETDSNGDEESEK